MTREGSANLCLLSWLHKATDQEVIKYVQTKLKIFRGKKVVSSFLRTWEACEKQQEVQDSGILSPTLMPACCVALGEVITKCLSFPSL